MRFVTPLMLMNFYKCCVEEHLLHLFKETLVMKYYWLIKICQTHDFMLECCYYSLPQDGREFKI